MFLHNYLKYFYDDIDSKDETNRIKAIVVPIDAALNRLSQATNKTIEQIANLDLGLDILANHIATSVPASNNVISYTAFNGRIIYHDLITRITPKIITRLQIGDYFTRMEIGDLHILIVDAVMFVETQLTDLKNYVIINELQTNPGNVIFDVKPMSQRRLSQYQNLPIDVLRKIAVGLTLSDIYNLCQTSKMFNVAICSSDVFWNEKLRKDYPGQTEMRKLGGLAGQFKSIYKSLSGRLYTFGFNNNGQLGLGSEDYKPRPIPTMISNLNNVTHVACGKAHTAIVSAGKLYTVGDGQYGQLGLGVLRHRVSIPTLYDLDPKSFEFNMRGPTLNKVTMVACGEHHTAVVANGRLYTFGYGEKGQLGHGNIYNTSEPTIIDDLLNVTFVACGSSHTAAISNGQLYMFGDNQWGQLGIVGFDDPVFPGRQHGRVRPGLVRELNNVTFVACGTKHTAAIADGKLYMFGNGSSGQLGLGNSRNTTTPTMLSLDNVTYVACGDGYTLVVSNGKLYSFGLNRSGQLGLGHFTSNIEIPTLVPGLNNVTKVACGRQHSAAIADGKLYTFGENPFGCLGLGGVFMEIRTNTPTLVPRLNDVMFVACGLKYTAVIAPKLLDIQ